MKIILLKKCCIFLLSLLFIFPLFNDIGALKYSMNTNLSKVDASFIGEHTYDHSGTSVLIAGDINGDGYQDMLIGAPNNSRGGNSAGAVYLIHGKSKGWSKNFSLANADAIFIGGTYDFEQIGSVLCAVGDVNGDGYDDFIIGSHNTLYLFFGGPNRWKGIINITKADVVIDSKYAEIVGIGDVNNDGFADILIVGMEGNSYILFGKPTSSWKENLSEDDADVTFTGNLYCVACHIISAIGDINGDHFNDILIDNYNPTKSIYTFYIFFGRPNWPRILPLSDANATIICSQCSMMEFYIAGAGDINGDGFNDILIGSPLNSENGLFSGKAYIFFGREKWNKVNSLSDANASIIGYDDAYLGMTLYCFSQMRLLANPISVG